MNKKFKKLFAILLCIVLLAASVTVVYADEEEGSDPVVTETPAEPTEEPIVDPTEEPTEAPTAEPTQPEVDPTGEATPTEKPTPEVTPGGDTTPTPIVEPEGTATPTTDPDAAGTPAPTNTPTPTKDPNATATPTPSSTPTPYATVIAPNHNQNYPGPSSASDRSVSVKSPSVIKVDGIEEALWDEIDYVPIRNVAWGDSGATGQFKLYWDKSYLYILVDVEDTTPDASDKMFSRQDCVEIFINEDGTKPAQYGEGDSHYKINCLGEIEYGHGGVKENIDCVIIERENGYMIEIGIPFVTINPSYGYMLGFDIRINDSQGKQWRDYMTQWSDTTMYTFKTLEKIGSVYLK